jgi:hypothetical protein
MGGEEDIREAMTYIVYNKHGCGRLAGGSCSLEADSAPLLKLS